jgi:hypothetical protein
MPGLSDDNEEPYEHPLWLPAGGRDLLKEIGPRVLSFDFLRPNAANEFRRFSTVRDIALRQGRASHTDIELLKLEMQEIGEDREIWRGLATSEQDRVKALDAEVERLKVDLARIEAKNSALAYQIKNRPTNVKEDAPRRRSLESFDDLEDWADDVLGEKVFIHAAALKDCRKHGNEKMLSKIEAALLTIHDYVVPAKEFGGTELIEIAKKKLHELGMEDTPCFVDREEAKRAPGYSVSYGSETRVLYDHIKYGNGYDNANQIRIYYFWDEEKKRFVIGKMPSHLRNNLTT